MFFEQNGGFIFSKTSFVAVLKGSLKVKQLLQIVRMFSMLNDCMKEDVDRQ